MTSEVSKTRIDQLGDRLRKGNVSDDDVRLLDSYRKSFSEAYENVVEIIHSALELEPAGRRAKTKSSIVDKLRREKIRLSQIQDIAGCRIVVWDAIEQYEVVETLARIFENAHVVDRREKPSHGYRAVHVVINGQGKSIEIQVRTELQHLWAELSEKLSDVIDPAVKYGAGDEKTLELLLKMSSIVREHELEEVRIYEKYVGEWSVDHDVSDFLADQRERVFNELRDTIKSLEKDDGEK